MTDASFKGPADDPLAFEAVRLYRRYQTEVVEAFVLCPWAERARLEGRVEERVYLGESVDVEDVLQEIARLDGNRTVEIGLLIFPKLSIAPNDFERLVSHVSVTDADRRELGTAPFALAAFHPGGRPDLATAERLIPFVRRTPDPTVQLVRQESLERVREGFNEGTHFVDLEALATLATSRDDTVPLRERIARANLKTIQSAGVAELERRFADIDADRRRSYASLGAT
jgi:hypothetical protein